MSDQFLAEIRVYGFDFPPSGWAFCDGQILPISQNTALFALLGTTYGGDGKAVFALPNLQGAAAVQQGQAPGLFPYFQGQAFGSPTVTLLPDQMPGHTHVPQASEESAEQSSPAPDRMLARAQPGRPYQSDATADLVRMAPESLAPAGGDLPHDNRSPTLVLNFCIALQGIFPPRP